MTRTLHLPRLAGALVGALALALAAPQAAPAAHASPAPQPTSTAAKPTSNPAAKPAKRQIVTPTLDARAALSADVLEPGPPSGAQSTPGNGRSGPYPGQVVPGFSAVVEIGDGTFWAMPDNGFGTKSNSTDYLLRIYKVKPDFETANGGSGEIQVQRYLSLRDPDDKIPFPIVNESSARRLLTGGDFDPESLVLAPDGSFWIGEEFGPFLLHVDSTGKVLQAPVQFPGGRSPQNPYLAPGEQPTIAQSKGFEALAASTDGHFLYPILEGALLSDPDQRRRFIYEFDTTTGQYTGRRWAYQVDDPANLVGDAFLMRGHTLLIDERDNYDGAAAVTKRIYQVDLDRAEPDGFLAKTLVVDLLKIANPSRIGLTTDPGEYGVSDPFSFPFVSDETIVRLRDGRLLVANDNNYPGDDARTPGTPDDTEMAIIDLRRTPAPPEHTATLIGHRGEAGVRPEETLASYEQAILDCADYIEPDVVPTKDGVLVARHEPDITQTTDVADHPEFADRRTTKTIDGVQVTGWFVEDFTLAELRTLRAVERLPAVRPENTRFDGLYTVATLDEVLDLARRSRTCDGDRVGVYPETKHPTYFAGIGLPTDQPLLDALAADGIDASYPVYIQSFETTNLRSLDNKTDIPLVQLIDCTGSPYDLSSRGQPTTYADLVTRSGLKRISTYADGIGPCADLLIPRDSAGNLLTPTPVISDAHRYGLVVHPFTFRVENQFLPLQFRSSDDPNADGDLAGLIQVFLRAGVDGFFTDNAKIAAPVVTPLA